MPTTAQCLSAYETRREAWRTQPCREVLVGVFIRVEPILPPGMLAALARLEAAEREQRRERIARAMYEQPPPPGYPRAMTPWEQIGPAGREIYLRHADRAIGAMEAHALAQQEPR